MSRCFQTLFVTPLWVSIQLLASSLNPVFSASRALMLPCTFVSPKIDTVFHAHGIRTFYLFLIFLWYHLLKFFIRYHSEINYCNYWHRLIEISHALSLRFQSTPLVRDATSTPHAYAKQRLVFSTKKTTPYAYSSIGQRPMQFIFVRMAPIIWKKVLFLL